MGGLEPGVVLHRRQKKAKLKVGANRARWHEGRTRDSASSSLGVGNALGRKPSAQFALAFFAVLVENVDTQH